MMGGDIENSDKPQVQKYWQDDLTVIVQMVTYNHEKYIQQAIESIVSQKTNFPFRLLIAEDCSSDKTREICIDLRDRYPDKIWLILNEKNLGITRNARQIHNLCFQSGAKYVAICEGDDYWVDPYKLQTQVEFLEKNPDFSICFHKIQIFENGSLIEDYLTKKVEKDVLFQSDLLEDGNFMHTPSVVFRNRIKDLPDWFSDMMPGDYVLWMTLTSQGEKIKYLDKIMAVYRVHGAGNWSTQSLPKRRQKFGLTMLYLMRQYNISHPKKISEYTVLLADSVYQFGFEFVSKKEYYSLMKWSINTVSFSRSQVRYFYTANLRRILLKPIVKNKISA